MKIDLQWKWPTIAGTYCRICVTQKNGAGDSVNKAVQIIGHRDGDATPNALFRLGSTTETIHVTLSNAYASSTATIRQLSASMLVPGKTTPSSNSPGAPAGSPSPRAHKSAVAGGSERPSATVAAVENHQTDEAVETDVALGSVGIIVADQSQLEDAVKEMVTHFDHYRKSSEAFAGQWFAMHHPNRTVAHLIGASGRSQTASNSL